MLQAELHYLEGDLESAEAFYKASIKSARHHKFIHEEALACELYGIFCIENHAVDKGLKQLHIAPDKYKQWGAIKKANKLLLFIDRVDSKLLAEAEIKLRLISGGRDEVFTTIPIIGCFQIVGNSCFCTLKQCLN